MRCAYCALRFLIAIARSRREIVRAELVNGPCG
jgi:hypothetical protein